MLTIIHNFNAPAKQENGCGICADIISIDEMNAVVVAQTSRRSSGSKSAWKRVHTAHVSCIDSLDETSEADWEAHSFWMHRRRNTGAFAK